MADRLTAQQFEDFTDLNLRKKITRTLTIDNDSIALTDITSFVRKWGKLKMAVYNKHPRDTGTFDFPALSLDLDNSDGEFNFGGQFFPLGKADFPSTIARLTVVMDGKTWLDYSGAVLEPEIGSLGIYTLLIEHPLTALTRREWIRGDRIGGDTGVDFFFNT